MKKNKKNKIYKFVFWLFFMSFLVIYFSELTGYYEYQNYQRTALTEEQIKKFEEDVKNGNEVDIKEYLVVNNKKYNNNLSKLASKLSDGISKLVNSGVEYTFKYISRLIDE
jgi:hypothetical protein